MLSKSLSLGLALIPFVSAAMMDVQVGPGGNLVFDPTDLVAQIGDVVTFHFNPKNHSVTQSSFASPCSPLSSGFNSGFNPVAADAVTMPTFNVTVNDTKPIWVYCAQTVPTSHCGQGMVFAINPNTTATNFTLFQNAALAFGASLSASGTATVSGSATSVNTALTTAAYGDVTIPAAGTDVLQTVGVTVGTAVYTTTYLSYPGSPAPSGLPGSGLSHTIIVGGDVGNVTFTPPNITANVFDTVVFEFQQKNHSVTQAAFADPCRPLTDANGVPNGFDSGFMPVAADATVFPNFTITVNDTNPIWGYCRQTGHCGQGMVFSINAVQDSARNFDAFKALAIELNGTSSAGGASPTSTGTSTSAGTSYRVSGAGLALTVVALFFSLF